MDETEAIKKGFNAGYLMEKLNPELAKKLRDGIQDKDHPYVQGFTMGSKQYTRESFSRDANDLLAYSKNTRGVEPDQEQNLDSGNKGVEPDF